MSALASLSASHVSARTVVASRSSRVSSISTTSHPLPHASKKNAFGFRSLNRRDFRRHAVSEPGVTAPPTGADPASIATWIAHHIVDEADMFAASSFPFSAEELIAYTKAFLATNNGADDPSRLAADFRFQAPVIGPLAKQEFLDQFTNFRLGDAFPDSNANFHAFRLDPFETNRVWFDNRFVGTHTGLLAGYIKATGKKVETPPQSHSLLFNKQGEVTQFTVGYVMDKQIGNSGGLGGVFGILYAVGSPLPFPEGKPWSKSIGYNIFSLVDALRKMVAKLVNYFKGFTVGA
uniref:Uncharacterized protein n=1 Tax=Mantoniella antarctica TaxID=81844 RepID=A0A7S0SP81_9CHLO